MKDELRNHLQLCYRPRMFPQVKLSLNVENNCRSRSPHNVPKKIESSHKNRSFTVGADATICVWFLGQIAVHKSQTYTHRRRIYTETKAKSRCFCLGGKIVCRTGNLMSECAVLCTQLLYFSLYFYWREGEGGCFM